MPRPIRVSAPAAIQPIIRLLFSTLSITIFGFAAGGRAPPLRAAVDDPEEDIGRTFGGSCGFDAILTPPAGEAGAPGRARRTGSVAAGASRGSCLVRAAFAIRR